MEIKIILYVGFLIGGISASAQTSNNYSLTQLIDTTIEIMKANSVNTKKVNWSIVSTKAKQMASGLKDAKEIGPVIKYLFKSINDFHGAFFLGDSTYQWEQKAPLYSKAINDEFEKAVHGIPIRAAIIKGDFGYLRIPSMMSFSKGQDVSDSLCWLLKQNLKGIIIDLRLNGGGNMYPMLLGVNRLLGSGKIGSFQLPDNRSQDWLLKDNNFYVDTALITSLKRACDSRAESMPVVLISSPATGSAGEDFIIAFNGRPNTILLGEKTAGYITVNNGFKITSYASMNLSVGYNSDRNGKVYKEAITPQILVKGTDNFK